jgi:hypothetical protein
MFKSKVHITVLISFNTAQKYDTNLKIIKFQGSKMIGFSSLFIILLFTYIISFILWTWVLIDCLRNETDNGNARFAWAIVIIITYMIGASLYYIVRRPKRILKFGM